MDSFDPASDGEQVQHGEEVPSQLLEARSQSAHILHSTEEAFDDVELGVKASAVPGQLTGVAFGGNDGERAFVRDALPDLSVAIGLVRDDAEWRFSSIEKRVHDLAAMNLPPVISSRSGRPFACTAAA